MEAPDVLIVDDDPDIRAMLAFTLADDFTIRTASGGAEAIEELTHRPPAAMVLDLLMPDVDGYAVLEARQAGGLAPDTCIVVLSGLASQADMVRSWSLGVSSHHQKPTDPALIVAELHAHLAATPAGA